MVAVQGFFGYGLTSIMGAVVAEIFQGRHFGTIFGTVMFVALSGGAAGPYVTGLIHDLTGSYRLAFLIGIAVSLASAAAIWMAGPRQIRAVAGRVKARERRKIRAPQRAPVVNSRISPCLPAGMFRIIEASGTGRDMIRHIQRIAAVMGLLVGLAALPAQANDEAIRFYGGLDLSARIGLQRSLIWVNTFPAIADGNVTPRTINAIREYQARLGRPQTGILRADELDRLLADAKRVRDGVGYRTLRDDATGTVVGVPANLIATTERVRRGTRLRSPNGDIDIVTMEIPRAERSLGEHYDMTLRNRPPAHYKVFRGNWFVIAGAEASGRSYYVRMHDTGGALRGFAISYDPMLTPILGPVVSAMSSDFRPDANGMSVAESQADVGNLRSRQASLPPSQNLQPLPPVQTEAQPLPPAGAPTGIGGPSEPIRQGLSTGTGFLVNSSGYFLTNAHVVTDCASIAVGIFGPARLVDADATNDIALLQVGAAVRAPH